jgi:hypothetical protein
MGNDPNDHPLIAWLVVVTKICAVLLSDSSDERAIDIGAHLSIAANLQVSHGIGNIEDEQTARGTLEEVLCLLTRGVKGERHRIAVGEEPDLRELGSTVWGDRGERGHGTLQQVLM